MKTWWMVVATLVMTGLLCMTTGCKDKGSGGGKEISSETKVHEKADGGTKVEKKEVIQKDEGVEVRKSTTETDKYGNVEKEKTEVTPAAPEEPKKKSVDVQVGGGGVEVHVQGDKDHSGQ